jgi:PleD family two-component response regulator
MARILILDPNGLRRSRYRKILEAQGHDVSEGSLSLHDVALYHPLQFDQIISDIPDVTQEAIEASLLVATHS